jgi:hypothetical protein
VYWHDWCIAHDRYDATALQADPGHRPVDPECWFWKTTTGLINDDLLRLWGEKKVRAAIELLERKGYAASRFNPKDPCDRTKRYRLISERLSADLEAWSGAQGSGERQKCRMHPAKMLNIRPQ